MTNYNERLDEVLDFIENYGVSASTEGFDKTASRAKAKQAITSLIKELVVEARIDELEHCCGKCGVWHSETCNISQRRLTFRERIAELKAQQEER